MPFAATQLVVPLKVHNGCGVLVATERFVQDFWNMSSRSETDCQLHASIFIS